MLFLKDIFKHSKGKDWKDGFIWLGWHFVCALMPIWITMIFLRIFKQPIGFDVFTRNAELAIYSASFLGTCLYVVLRDFRKNSYPSRAVLSIILVPLLLFSGLMFGFIAILDVLKDINIPQPLQVFDREFIAGSSLILFPFVFFLTFLIVVVDNVRSNADIRDIQEEDYNQLSHEFEALRDK